MPDIMTPQRILIDGYFLGKPFGFGRFIQELCRALRDIESEFEFIVAVPESVNDSLLCAPGRLRYHRIPDANFVIWEQFKIPLHARQNRCVLIHFPYNTSSFATLGIRSVTTVHDITFLIKDAERSFKGKIHNCYVKTLFYTSTARSDAIISVSETTRSALDKHGISSCRIYNTVDGFLEKEGSDFASRLSRPYFLHRGSYASGHRNTERILEAFLSCPELTGHFDLNILGVPEGADRWNTTADQPVRYLPRVTDSDLASLYSGSTCVIAASLLEGFCLPIIEAFGFGSPVITSNINPMMEIAGDAAILVNPYSVDELAQAMLGIVSDQALAKELVKKGQTRLATFASGQMAAELLALYRRVLSPQRIDR